MREELEGEFSVVGTQWHWLPKKKEQATRTLESSKATSALVSAKAQAAHAQKADDSLWDDLLPSKPIKTRYSRSDIWQLGNKAAREHKDEQIKAATVPSLCDARV